jgi:carboxypeptidase family protein
MKGWPLHPTINNPRYAGFIAKNIVCLLSSQTSFRLFFPTVRFEWRVVMKQSLARVLPRLPLTMALIIVLASAVLLKAQEPRGTITGKVADASQAVIQHATVKITNVAMGWTVSLSSNDVGAYDAPYLLPGTYSITVEAPGFKKFVKQGVVLR